jgi:hypothetical protein
MGARCYRLCQRACPAGSFVAGQDCRSVACNRARDLARRMSGRSDRHRALPSTRIRPATVRGTGRVPQGTRSATDWAASSIHATQNAVCAGRFELSRNFFTATVCAVNGKGELRRTSVADSGSSSVFQLVGNRLQNDPPIADYERVHTDIDVRVCRSCPPMQQGMFAVYYLEWIFEIGVGKLISQGFRRIANGAVTFQNAVFAEQDDVAGVVVLQITLDIALVPAC